MSDKSSERPEDIIEDDEINRIHAHANFGDMNKRQVVNEGVLKYAFGYTTGHTQYRILYEHKLLHYPRTDTLKTTLTAKGMRYLRAVYGPRLQEICELGNRDAGKDATNE